MANVEKCGNCERVIGKLETPFVFKEHVVCPECYTRLSTPVQHAVPDVVPVTATMTHAASLPRVDPVASTTDAVVGRVILIVILLAFIGICAMVILAKMSTW